MPHVNTEVCTGCETCVEVCHIPGAVIVQQGHAVLNPDLCDSCEACVKACPSEAMRPGWALPAENGRQQRPFEEVIVEPVVMSSPGQSAQVPVPRSSADLPFLPGGKNDWLTTIGGVISLIGGAFVRSKWGMGEGGGSGGGGGGGRGGGGRRRRKRGRWA